MRGERIGYGVIWLLAVGMVINYVDRGSLATAAPLIKDELHLSNTEAGVLLSAFFWTYTPFQLIAGWLAERINPYRTLAIGVGLWSIATFATGLVGGFTALLLLRLVLGAGESATFPCNAKILAHGLPSGKLGMANGLIGAGQALGPAIGTFGGGLLIAGYGWRPVFLMFGLGSALWLLPWLFATRRTAFAHVEATTPPPSFAEIVSKRELWGAGLGHLSHNYALYFIISWLPLYLVKSRGFSVAEMSEIGGMLYLFYAVCTQATGWIADKWMAAGASSTKVRKTITVTAHLGLAACMILCAVGSPVVSIVGLFASGLFLGLNTATIFAVGQALGGPVAAGKWVGVQNCIGNLSGIVAPLVTGMLVDAAGGSFGLAFAVAGVVTLCGTLGWGILIRKIEPIAWR